MSIQAAKCDRPRLFITIVIWAGFVLAENHGNTVTRAHVNRSIGIMHPSWDLCLPMMNGGSAFLSGKVFSTFRKRGGIIAEGTIAVRLLRITNDFPSAKLGWVETGGTHQFGPGTEGVRLRQSGHHCGRDRGVLVSNRQCQVD